MPQYPTLKNPVSLGLRQPIPFPLGKLVPSKVRMFRPLFYSAIHGLLTRFWDTLTPQPVVGGEWRMRNVRARGRQPGHRSVSNLPDLSLFWLNEGGALPFCREVQQE